MKLAHYQIEHIRQWISMQNIWYDEIKDELLDHMVCAVEEQMEFREVNFADALAQVCSEVNPQKLQRQKLKYEHLKTLKDTLGEMLKLKAVKALGLIASLSILVTLGNIGTSPSTILKLYMFLTIVSVFTISASFLFRLRGKNPLSNIYVVSRSNTIISSSLIIISLTDIFLDDWLMNHPVFLFMFMGVLTWYVTSGLMVLNDSYNHHRHATH